MAAQATENKRKENNQGYAGSEATPQPIFKISMTFHNSAYVKIEVNIFSYRKYWPIQGLTWCSIALMEAYCQ